MVVGDRNSLCYSHLRQYRSVGTPLAFRAIVLRRTAMGGRGAALEMENKRLGL